MKKRLSILLVDDDRDDQDVFKETVAEIDASIECLIAYNGQEALKILQERLYNLPDYIFLDLNMPKMNGKQCLQALKREDDFRKIPVIIYSTSLSLRDKEDTCALGAVGFLTKPSNIATLKREIELIIQKDAKIIIK